MQKNKQYWLLNISCVAILAVMFVSQQSKDAANILPAQVSSSSAFCTDMVGYWKFDTGTGLVAIDSSGQSNTGILDTATWTESVPSQIAFWNPSAIDTSANGSILVETGSNLDIVGDITISVWVNYTVLTNKVDGNVLLGYAGNTVETTTESSDDNYLYSLGINGTTKSLRFMWENGSSADDVIIESDTIVDLTNNEWNHIVAVRDATSKQVRFYVNGTQLGSTKSYTLVPSGQSGSAVLTISAGPHDIPNTYFKGKLDDLRIYTKPLISAQVSSLYSGVDTQLGCTCGNLEIEPPEECDDGNADSTDSCTASCTKAVCGDGYVQPSNGEECEPKGTATCSDECKNIDESVTETPRVVPPNCGNRIVNADEGEECDEGHLNGSGECSEYCTISYCGDGILSPEVNEECEPIPTSYENGVPVFTEPICGDSCAIPVRNASSKIIAGCTRLFLPPCETEAASSSSTLAESTSSESLKNAAPSLCGNTVLNEGEECDNGGICQGGDANGAIITNDVELAICTDGGGVSVAIGNDGCSEACTNEYCGDGTVQTKGKDGVVGTFDDEQCDNGSVCSNNLQLSCTTDEQCESVESCTLNINGVNTCGGVDTGAACNTDADCVRYGRCIYNYEADENCTNACTVLQTASTSSASNSASLAQSSTQIAEAVCGNFIIEGSEECDDGIVNSDTLPDACRTDCRNAFCGDGVLDAAEQCDTGENNSDEKSDSCRTDCRLPACGDGIRDSGEDCDGGPTCQNDCTFPALSVCGNGIVEGNEKCDDGNVWPGDGCNSKCMPEPKITPVQNKSSVATIKSSALSSMASSTMNSEALVAGQQYISEFSSSSAISSLQPIAVALGASSSRSVFTLQPLQRPIQPVAQQPIASVVQQPVHSPVGDTGPASIIIVASGAAGGFLWKRKKSRS